MWRTGREAEQDSHFEELPAPSYEEIEVRHEIKPEAASEITVGEDGGWIEHRPEPEMPKLAAPLVTAAASASARPSMDSFFLDDTPLILCPALSIKVETAEELLALPPEERADMTAFLGPSELAATFRATEDPHLKKAVIDTLEHIGSPASLNALGNCFEDDDCDVQRYALEAADRLLGVA